MISKLKHILKWFVHYSRVLLLVLSALLLVFIVTSYFVMVKPDNIRVAKKQGQRVEIALDSGKVSGGIVLPKPKVIATKPVAALAVIPQPQNLQSFVTSTNAPLQQEMPTTGKPSISILIMDLGPSRSSTELAFQLPKEVALGFSPYTAQLEIWSSKAKVTGHTLWLNVPMQTAQYPADDPGPFGLIAKLPAEENQLRLGRILERLPSVRGVYMSPDETFTQNADLGIAVVNELNNRHVTVLYTNVGNKTFPEMVKKRNMPIMETERIIDETIAVDAIQHQLKEAEDLARQFGHVTVVGHAYPVTISTIGKWMATLKGIDITQLIAPIPVAASVPVPPVTGPVQPTIHSVASQQEHIVSPQPTLSVPHDVNSANHH